MRIWIRSSARTLLKYELYVETVRISVTQHDVSCNRQGLRPEGGRGQGQKIRFFDSLLVVKRWILWNQN